MSIMTRLFGRKPAAYATATGVNHEGFPAWQRSLQERYVQVLLTNTLSHTYYASQGDNYAQTLATHAEMLAMDPTFAARALVYAREKGTMRMQPIIGLVALSQVDLALFRRIFRRIILTPGDVQDFVQIVRSGQIRPGLGRAIKSEIGAWMNQLSEYHVIKYGGGAAGTMTLRDVLRLTHPQPVDERANALFTYLVNRDRWRTIWADQPELLPQIAALEALKRTRDPAEQRALVAAGRLPYEIVTGAIRPDVALWQALMRQMPYFALLRHVVTLQRAGVLADPAAAAYVAERLTDAEAMRRARILPFRLHAAWIMFEPGNPAERQVQQALEQALEQAFVNLPPLTGRVVVAPDVSGSMSSSINVPSKVRYIDIAGLFAGALLRTNPAAQLLPFDTKVHQLDLRRAASLMQVTQAIGALLGGGTAVSAPIAFLLQARQVVDVFIGITDNEEWAQDGYGYAGFLPTWREYRASVAPKARAFLITIAPYPHAMVPPEEPGVQYIYGWADHVPGYIAQTLNGLDDQLAAVVGIEV